MDENNKYIDIIHRKNVVIFFLVMALFSIMSLSYNPFVDFIVWFQGIVEGGKQTIDKPVLYLYPDVETDVVVILGSSDDMTVSYPQYDNGWHVTAQPDGTLSDDSGWTYDYLYWESDTDKFVPDFSEGFCVKGDDTASFLREQLSYMDLSDREQDDFITYWLPRMQNNDYNLISFQFENYDNYESLDVYPVPDNTLCVFMAYKPVDKFVDIKPQVLPGNERTGFTIVEWGGMEVK